MARITKNSIATKAKSFGGLSNTDKMPCYSWAISASECKMGSVLAKNKGSVCAKCYARKGNYTWPNTVRAHARRLSSYLNDRESWTESFIDVGRDLVSLGESHFRWFDSGDIQDVKMLEDILRVCSSTKALAFWIPTKEVTILAEYLELGGDIPSNTNIRVSSFMIGDVHSKNVEHLFDHPRISRSFVDVKTDNVFQCPAQSQGHQCRSCRACWDPKLSISYEEI